MQIRIAIVCGFLLPVLSAGCKSGGETGDEPSVPEVREGECEHEGSEPPDFLKRIGCKADFDAISSDPLVASIPGARSAKVMIDQADGDALYFQNSTKYATHYEFTAMHLSGGDLPYVTSIATFNSEYYAPDRRFVLGAITYYEAPNAWTLELSPYDKASPDMIARLYAKAAEAAYFGPALRFHPTSEAIESLVEELPESVSVLSSEALYADIDYQPLNLGSAIGRLRFIESAALATEYVGFRDIVVLDRVPNDISVVLGMITEEFQTPLSHVNVLAQTRGTPNMGLREATENEALKALDGKWVRLTVGAFDYQVEEVTSAEADAFWEDHRPEPITLPAFNDEVTDLLDIEDIVVESEDVPLREAIRSAILAFGGKASHYSILAKTEGVPVRKAFGIPVHYYVQFMEQNGLYEQLDEMLADSEFQSDPAVRDARLRELRDAIMQGEVDAGFQELLREKLDTDFPGLSMRFRSSTNSEDLDGFPCAGCYESHTGDAGDWEDILEAVRETWSSIWLFRTFEERSYHGIDHKSVAMALLVHHNFPDEEANGVAVTADPFGSVGMEPAFYINVQHGGDAEVVHPPPNVTSDQLMVYYTMPDLPIVYLSHSSLIAEGTEVLTRAQVHMLADALEAIHLRFSPAYGPAAGNPDWYGLEVDFKFDDDGSGEPQLFIKQARPHPGRGQ